MAHKVLVPPGTWPRLNLGELWQYRYLLLLLAWRDVSANYRQSLIGFGWALFRPFFAVAVFTIVFGKIAQMPSEGVSYPLFSLAGFLPWMCFSSCLTAATNSVVMGSNLVTKVYFPRLILPLASVLTSLVDFGIQFVALLCFCFAYQVSPGWELTLVPVWTLLCLITGLAVGIWLTAFNVRYRDAGHLLPFLTQLWMWLSPLVYPASLVPARWRMLYGLNPMAGIIEGFRWSVVGSPPPDPASLSVSLVMVAGLLISGLYYFRQVELTFADVI